MNRQALAFLTMFSLVLMLSVYYVTLPSDTETVMKDTQVATVKKQSKNEEEQQNETTSEKEEQSEQEKLQENIEAKKQEEMNEQSSVIADEQADEEEKQKALASLEVLKEQANLQETIINTLKELNIEVAVEINDTTCVVTVFKQQESKELAKKIMDTVTSITGKTYLIEIMFQ